MKSLDLNYYFKIDVQIFCSQKHILERDMQERTKSIREIFQFLVQSVLFISMMSSFPLILIMNSITEVIIRKVSGTVGILIMDHLCLPSSLTDIVQLQGYKQVYPNLRCGWMYFFWHLESSGSMFQVKYYLNSKIYSCLYKGYQLMIFKKKMFSWFSWYWLYFTYMYCIEIWSQAFCWISGFRFRS